MKLKITFKEKDKRISIHSMTFNDYRNTELVITSDNNIISDGSTILSDVYFNNEYTNGNGKQLMDMCLQSISGRCNDEAIEWIEIETMEIIDGDNTFEIPNYVFWNFKLYRINGIDKTFTKKEYDTLWRYFSNKNRQENAINALLNRDDIPKNVQDYLTTTLLDEFSDHFNEDTCCTGEDELYAIDNYIKEHCGGTVNAVLISNKETEHEIVSIVPMLKNQYEKLEEILREYWNGGDFPEEYDLALPMMYDYNRDVISLEFVDEMFMVDYVYEIISSPGAGKFLISDMLPEVLEKVIKQKNTEEELVDYLKRTYHKAVLLEYEDENFIHENFIISNTFILYDVILVTCDNELKNSIYGIVVADSDKEYAENLMKEAYQCWQIKDINTCKSVLKDYTIEMLDDVCCEEFITSWLKAKHLAFNEDLGYIPLETYCFDVPKPEEYVEDISDWRDARTTIYFFKKSSLMHHFKNISMFEHFINHYTYDDVESDILENVKSVFKYTSAK